ncbi:N-acetylglucosaminyl deacetylase, LmbE family [Candidatus Frackibacter sp. WG12]|uniref:PIG-L deacetylase family protein n=1 Tax=Candidatus Frackibacter sp. WG12 TaxID=2017977 RepID=UPI0008D89A39|nr:PIG-L deacetylase family protein [Candidatus Frackibacter sp. WG12]SEM88411.1 N-acetylglucosaminyl deacetylase, LmbE family [Candidatus Frackibacter sp. WG12]
MTISNLDDFHELKLNEDEDSILILAPHCDDEALSCGGIIQDALDKDIAVQVVFLTNGDGFRWGAVRNFLRPFLSHKSFKKFGELRQQESIKALQNLGLPQENIYFLGYPDRGISFLWGEYWHDEKVYLSRYTQTVNNPYTLAYKQEQPYTGRNIIEYLVEILIKHQPTKIFVSSTFDEHSDHWAAYNFLYYALAKIELDKKLLKKPEIYQYLTHRGKWPLPKGEDMKPPKALIDNIAEWSNFQLTDDQKNNKEEAIRKYKSQLKVTKRYLLSFVKDNEIFIKDNPKKFNTESEISSIKLPSYNASYRYQEPASDNKNRRRFPGGDIVEGELSLNKSKLVLNLEMKIDFTHKYSFKFHLHLLTKEDNNDMRHTLDFAVTTKKDSNEASIKMMPFQSNRLNFDKMAVKKDKNRLKVAINIPKLASGEYIFFNAESYFKNRPVDRTAWKIIKIN